MRFLQQWIRLLNTTKSYKMAYNKQITIVAVIFFTHSFISYLYMINHGIWDVSFYHYLEYFSWICGHARITTPTLLLPHFFKKYRCKESLFLLPHFFFVTFQLSTTAQSVQQNKFIFHFGIFLSSCACREFFMCHLLFWFYILLLRWLKKRPSRLIDKAPTLQISAPSPSWF